MNTTYIPRKRILVVGTHFDVTRLPVKRINKFPQAMGTVYLAGAFHREHCEVRCYNELASGPLVQAELLAWPDMVVMTGLSVCFDRMLQITGHVKSKNPNCVVVAGGPPVRILTNYSRRFFDYVCTGDVEQIQEVVHDAFGPAYVAADMLPRMDLAYWIKSHGHVESSRNCNFACSFCSLTGEGARYGKYSVDYLRTQLELVRETGRKYSIHLIDNNFYGKDRQFFNERVDVLREYRDKGYFKYWTALLTGDFYLKEENLKRVADSGCAGFFTGIESFDEKSLRDYNKHQNTRLPQIDLMRRSLQHGLVIFYGLFADIYNRSLEDIRSELHFITGQPEMMLPSFVTLPIPLMGTPLFEDALQNGRFFAGTRLRDLDGSTISMEPHSSLDAVLQFVRDAQNLRGYRRRIARHALAFYRNYRRVLSPSRMALALAPNALLTMNQIMTADWFSREARAMRRTHISGTEVLDACYTPTFPVEARYERYFQPTMLTLTNGEVNPELAEDLLSGVT
ncbi:MAG: radical SAM protein, partial [Leptospiraceae bacterium]|nr:radical SAM protein [Leptospiraceae bacterium]